MRKASALPASLSVVLLGAPAALLIEQCVGAVGGKGPKRRNGNLHLCSSSLSLSPPPITFFLSHFCFHVLLFFPFFTVLLFSPSPLGSPGLPLEGDSWHKTSLIISPSLLALSLGLQARVEEQQAWACFRMTKDSPWTPGPGESGEGSCQEALLTCSAVVWLCCSRVRRRQRYSSDVCSEGLSRLCQLFTKAQNLIGLYGRMRLRTVNCNKDWVVTLKEKKKFNPYLAENQTAVTPNFDIFWLNIDKYSSL